jgi:hypothetical protein
MARCCWIAAAPANAEAFSHDDIATIINEPSSMQPNIRLRPVRSITCGMNCIRNTQNA